jgi:hypothetical protein
MGHGYRRRVSLLCWAGSVGLAVAGIAGAGSASAGSTPSTPTAAAAAPSFTYSSDATAIGVQVQLAQQPEPTSIPDLFDVETPSSNAHLDSFGTSDASGHIGNLNGLGQFPSLICLAASGGCNQIPISQLTGGVINSFPPPDPLDAHATYPANQTAVAPLVGSKAAQLKVDSKGLMLGAGTAAATAHALSATTDAADQNLSLAGAITIGSVRTTTSQVATAGGVTTIATSTISNIDVGTGKLLHIGSVRSTVVVHSKPGQKGTDTSSSRVSGVTVLGLAARIDSRGIHIDRAPTLPASATNLLQSAFDKVLKTAGLSVKTATIKRADRQTGHNVSLAGLAFVFKHTVKGTTPLTIALPAGVPCPIAPITSKFPVDPCSGVALSLNAHYTGTIGLGELGVVSLAAPGTPGGNLPGGNVPGNPSTPGSNLPGGTGNGGVPGGPGAVAGGPGASSGPAPQVSPPAVARPSRSIADQLAGASGRLLWFFPLILIGLVSIAGRFRVPARLPRT